MTLLIALIALAISVGLFMNGLFNRPTLVTPELFYYFQSEQIEAMYYDEQEDYLRFPHYGSDKAAGFDIKASQNVTLDPGQFMVVPTGVHFNIPDGYELQVRSRSGLAAKHGIQVLNSPGTIDSDYVGEVKVILRNGGANRYTVKFGERIAQIVFAKMEDAPKAIQLKEKSLLGMTLRGEGGLGSTGTV